MSDANLHRICGVDDIDEGQARGFEIGETSLFALKRDGRLFVYRNSCPHLGVELNWLEDQFLDLDGALIQCATHGALFDPESGECLSGPCRGQALTALPFHIENGGIHVRL
jgi:nitrite reductase/ring-hydroxylating ferredoxin subunit